MSAMVAMLEIVGFGQGLTPTGRDNNLTRRWTRCKAEFVSQDGHEGLRIERTSGTQRPGKQQRVSRGQTAGTGERHAGRKEVAWLEMTVDGWKKWEESHLCNGRQKIMDCTVIAVVARSGRRALSHITNLWNVAPRWVMLISKPGGQAGDGPAGFEMPDERSF